MVLYQCLRIVKSDRMTTFVLLIVSLMDNFI